MSGGMFSSPGTGEPTGWNHIVLNFLGPADRQGFRLYRNGVEATSDIRISNGDYASGDGSLVVGRYFVNNNGGYGGFDMDELLLFNVSLSQTAITQLTQAV